MAVEARLEKDGGGPAELRFTSPTMWPGGRSHPNATESLGVIPGPDAIQNLVSVERVGVHVSPGRWEAEMSPGSREEEKATTLSPGDHLFSARGPSEAAGLAEHPRTSPRFWWGSVVSYPAALHLDWRDTRLSLFHRCLAWARIERVWNGWTPGPRFSIAPPHSHWPSPRPPQSSLPLRPQCEEGARPGMNAFLL